MERIYNIFKSSFKDLRFDANFWTYHFQTSSYKIYFIQNLQKIILNNLYIISQIHPLPHIPPILHQSISSKPLKATSSLNTFPSLKQNFFQSTRTPLRSLGSKIALGRGVIDGRTKPVVVRKAARDTTPRPPDEHAHVGAGGFRRRARTGGSYKYKKQYRKECTPRAAPTRSRG